jgi:response regulator RpfG family c-di-GMP phosphodiesterase
LNGYETARLLKRLEEKYHRVPIIAHGDLPSAIGKKQAGEQGLNDYLQKPFDKTQLYDLLQKHLDKDQPSNLAANLDKCTDGDMEFRRELAQLLANNISELLTNIEKALKLNDPTIFVRAVHKTKTTLSILDDGELSETLNRLQSKIGADTAPAEMDQHVQKLNFWCKKTISDLNALAVQE